MERIKKNITWCNKEVYEPEFFRLTNKEDYKQLKLILDNKPYIRIFDEISGQIKELIKSRDPKTKFTAEKEELEYQEYIRNVTLDEYGVWVYYPWLASVVHLLDEAEFIEVRTNRNKNKITKNEQDILSTKKVGVVGLSVGQSVALTMAMERSFGTIRIADFDKLELSNLNRIRTSVVNLELEKVVATAREIKEIDPFLKVEVFNNGLLSSNIDQFMFEGGSLDLIIEECDSLNIKVLVREKAREAKIPVLMDTSDRGMLDVERFDNEDLGLLHGLVDNVDIEALSHIKNFDEFLPHVIPILGGENVSARMLASMLNVGETITTWPQLASAVVYGGGGCADVYRRIMLGEPCESGRYYLDIEHIVNKEEEKPSNTFTYTFTIKNVLNIDVEQYSSSLNNLLSPYYDDINVLYEGRDLSLSFISCGLLNEGQKDLFILMGKTYGECSSSSLENEVIQLQIDDDIMKVEVLNNIDNCVWENLNRSQLHKYANIISNRMLSVDANSFIADKVWDEWGELKPFEKIKVDLAKSNEVRQLLDLWGESTFLTAFKSQLLGLKPRIGLVMDEQYSIHPFRLGYEISKKQGETGETFFDASGIYMSEVSSSCEFYVVI